MMMKIRMSDAVSFVKQVLGQDYKPPAGYTWWDVFWALTKRKRYPKHPQAEQLKSLGLKIPNMTGRNISPYTTRVVINQ